jgi:1-acyl-sn-glycerol-3-phosphate acyltransferase
LNSENKSKKQKKKPFENLVYDFVKVTGALPAWLWLRPKYYYPFGKPCKDGPLLVAANHYRAVDPVAVLLSFPKHRVNILATKQLFNTKISRFFFTRMHCIEVDRENFSISAFHEVVDRLKQGGIIGIFPEGKINEKEESGSLLDFKSGVALMAHRGGACVLPMYIEKRTKWYHRQRIVMGTPVDISEKLGKIPSMQAVNEATEYLREKELELRKYLDDKHPKKM